MACGAVEHVVFAIHPLLYEAEPPQDIVALNHRVYLEAEVEVKERCVAAIARLAPSALFVQLAGASTEFVDRARERLGAARALHLQNGSGDDLGAIYRGLVAQIRAHLAAHRLRLDPATCSSELWGESFEGCVPGYGSALASGLQLQRRPRMVYEHTVCDAPFMRHARQAQRLVCCAAGCRRAARADSRLSPRPAPDCPAAARRGRDDLRAA